jgi:dihydroorotase
VEKQVSYSKAPSGVPGVETALPLLLDWVNKGEVRLKQVVALMSENPARIYNIQKRGKLEPGFFADIVAVDLKLTKKIKNSRLYTKCGWSPFEGVQLTGWPIMTIVNGRVVFKDDEIVGSPTGREVF